MTNDFQKPQIAFLFRYGPAEHTELFHCIPDIIAGLARDCTVHYYGLKSPKPVPELISKNAILHLLPFTVKRTNPRDKITKTLLWLILLPFMALHCRLRKIDAIYIDETLPLSAALTKIFFPGKIAVTVTDFFLNIYGKKNRLLRPFVNLINRMDMAAWRKTDLVFTRAKNTRGYLTSCGIPAGRVVPVYDPCDTSIYHPLNKAECRKRFNFSGSDLVLVHHGILHPNKGNDRIIELLPEILKECPNIRFLLIGDGPEMPRLRSQVKEKNLENIVIFTGWLSKLSEVNSALNAGDIGLVMRTGLETDNFAMTGALIHSMACALPVLAVRLRSIEEVIQDGQNGFLFNPGNMAEFKKKLLALANNPALRQEFGQKALKVVKQSFDMQKVARQTVDALRNLCLKQEGAHRDHNVHGV